MTRITEWWRVQNTGYSDGQSWFDNGGSIVTHTREDAEKYAKSYIESIEDSNIQVRIAHTTFEHSKEKDVTTTLYYYVNS